MVPIPRLNLIWEQDIFSYNVEQSRGDSHNMIVILMEYHDMSLQEAVDYVGDLCKQTIDVFCLNKRNLPSWGPEVDDMVARYVQGLQDWIVGFVTLLLNHSLNSDSPSPDRFIGASRPRATSAQRDKQ